MVFYFAGVVTHGLQVSCCVSLVSGCDFLCVPDYLFLKEAEGKIGIVQTTRIGGSIHDVKCSTDILTTHLDDLLNKKSGDNLRPSPKKSFSANFVKPSLCVACISIRLKTQHSVRGAATLYKY